MQGLSEKEMGSVTGRDGITVSLQSETGISADQIKWTMNPGDSALENSLRIGKANNASDSFKLIPIDPNGAAATHALDIALAIDAYTNSDGRAGLGLDATWNRMRMQMDSVSVSDDTRSFGSLAIDSAGRFALFGDGGLFNSSTDKARLILNIGNVDASGATPTDWTVANPGQIFYKMTDTGAQLDNFAFLLDMHEGTVGIDSDGLIVQSAPGTRTDFNLTFDVLANAATPFEVNSSSLPLLYFGWRGGLDDFLFNLKSQGITLSDGTLSQGITTSIGFNLASDFQFVAGEAGGDHSYLEFTKPQSLYKAADPDKKKDVEFGSIALGAIPAGYAVGNICYGGTNGVGQLTCGSGSQTPVMGAQQSLGFTSTDSGLALVARDWGLHAYSSGVSYRDGTNSAWDVDNENWALIYTLGDLNSNMYLYPQSGAGIKMDVITAIQTLGTTPEDRWKNGTNFMIGDTDKNLAIGIMGADLLFAAKGMDIGLGLYAGGLKFSSDQGVRLQARGMFGGGDIPYMESPVNGSYIDVNLEMDDFAFSILPALSRDAVLFGGFLSFANLNNSFSNETYGAGGNHNGHDDGTYISLAEPHFDKLDADLRLADITGDVEIPYRDTLANADEAKGGVINLIPASDDATNHKPRLRIENRMLVGTAATKPGGGAGDPLEIGRVEFGGKDLGSMIIPSAHIYSSITLEQQD
ncbi:hypothetical protein A11A3_10596 [Alcanivorax hongdengensis A-11-3]|uniref:Uncharacterized protein n=2 Tax=Alcanivorax hongdengensis TaxID=519051 RepID=L0WAV6_9GAMM|nr:hypothetical protein A11A3_10596 [Alcanivorax hongdengensis A-11-3]